MPLRFPDLAVAMSEGGIGWVPMLLDRADYVLEHSASGSESNAWPSELRPSEVLRRNFWFCTIDDPSTIELRHRIGVDHIMVESDYPHADSTWPDTQPVLEKTLGHLPEDELRMMAAGNAARLFRHPLPPADDWRHDGTARPAAGPGGVVIAAPELVVDADGHVVEPRRRLGRRPRAVPARHHPRRTRLRARRGGRHRDPGRAAGHAGHPGRPLLGPARPSSPWKRRYPGGSDPRGPPGGHGRRGHRPGRAVPLRRAVLLGPRRPAAPPCAIARAYNDWLASYCAADPARLFGAAMLPMQDPAAAAAELRRARRELGFVAAFVRPNPCCGRSLSDRAYEPVWEAAEESAMTVAVHEGSSVIVPTLGSDRPFNPLVLHAVSHSFEEMLACAQLIAFGVLERHPGLRVVFLESSGGLGAVLAGAPRRAGRELRRLLPRAAPGPERVLRPPVLDQLRDRRADPSGARAVHRREPHRVGIGLPAPRRHLPRRGGRRCAAPWPRSRPTIQARILGHQRRRLYRLPPAGPRPGRAAGDARAGRRHPRGRGAATGTPRSTSRPTGTSSPTPRSTGCPTRRRRPRRPGRARRRRRALVLPSGPAYAVAYAAAAKIGAVTAGVNDRLSPPERRRCLAVARPRLVVATADLGRDTALGEVAEVDDVVEVDATHGRRRRRWPSCGPGPGRTTSCPKRRAGPRPPRGRGVHLGDHGGAQGRGVHLAPARGHRRHRRRRAVGQRGPGPVVHVVRPSRAT